MFCLISHVLLKNRAELSVGVASYFCVFEDYSAIPCKSDLLVTVWLLIKYPDSLISPDALVSISHHCQSIVWSIWCLSSSSKMSP